MNEQRIESLLSYLDRLIKLQDTGTYSAHEEISEVTDELRKELGLVKEG